MKILWRKFGILLALSSSAIFAEEPASYPNEVVSPLVIGELELPVEDWKSTYLLVGGSTPCTATRVGPLSVLTAAHCTPEDDVTEILVSTKIKKCEEGVVTLEGPAKLSCERHPLHKTDDRFDYALCEIEPNEEENLVTLFGEYESLIIDQNFTSVGHTVFLAGFGCTLHPRCLIPTCPSKLHGGDAHVKRTANIWNNIIETKDKTVTCSGDSGGAVFASGKTHDGAEYRGIMAVNSRSDLARTSIAASVSHPKFIQWAADWVRAGNDHKVDRSICGLTLHAQGCATPATDKYKPSTGIKK